MAAPPERQPDQLAALRAAAQASAAPRKRKPRQPGGKRTRLSLEQKMAVLGDKDNGMKQAAIARKYSVSEGVISTIIKRRATIQEAARTKNKKAKSTKAGKYPQLEHALYDWLDVCNSVFAKTSIGVSQRMVCSDAARCPVHVHCTDACDVCAAQGSGCEAGR